MRGQKPVWWAWHSEQSSGLPHQLRLQARQTHQPEASAPGVRWQATVPDLQGALEARQRADPGRAMTKHLARVIAIIVGGVVAEVTGWSWRVFLPLAVAAFLVAWVAELVTRRRRMNR